MLLFKRHRNSTLSFTFKIFYCDKGQTICFRRLEIWFVNRTSIKVHWNISALLVPRALLSSLFTPRRRKRVSCVEKILCNITEYCPYLRKSRTWTRKRLPRAAIKSTGLHFLCTPLIVAAFKLRIALILLNFACFILEFARHGSKNARTWRMDRAKPTTRFLPKCSLASEMRRTSSHMNMWECKFTKIRSRTF